ncbi:hypothetical protein [Paraliomyxa miuraensis]|uniref:hypothetical protein n=1 Tax=Paraliomyxa miuraensis TaxID=376150 RepID=UPI002251FDC0|nr:hypothetical protein [Paraliomyxa miuraensis]MCX4246983.1 hypothetical protein [Paraliomyxa miuraensis]
MAAAERIDQVADHRHRHVEAAAGGGLAHGGKSRHPRDEGAQRHRDQPAGQASPKAHAPEVGEHHQPERRQPHHRMGEGAEQEAQRDEAQRNPAERGEQGGARGVAAQRVGHPGPREFDESRSQRGHQARLPRHARGVLRSRRGGRQLGRQHHQEHVGEQRDRVDPVGQRADVVAAFGLGQALGLVRIVEIAHQQRDRDPGQHAPVEQLVGEAQHEATQRIDEQQLDEVVQCQTEETVDVASDEPAHGQAT